MNFLNRAGASMRRRPAKTAILLALVFILGNLISGAISIRNSVQSTDANLRAQLPAIAVLDWDWMAMSAHYERYGATEPEALSADHIREVGALEYVQAFNYSVQAHLFGAVERAFAPIYLNRSDEESLDDIRDWDDSRGMGADFNVFDIRGQSSTELFEVQTGLMGLVDGRLMTEDEIRKGEPVAVVSLEFARANGLVVGSEIPLISGHFPRGDLGGREWWRVYMSDNLAAYEEIPLTIVGIIDFVGELEGDFFEANAQKIELENRIFVPNAIAEAAAYFRWEAILENDPWMLEHMAENGLAISDMVDYSAMFLLNDPGDLVAFSEAAAAILPGFYRTVDLSNTFGDMAGAMETMLMIANYVLWVAVGATWVVLGLLITLFLRDRKHEIGIYVALGERKIKIVGQVLLEVLAPSVVAVSLALFSGALLSAGLSQQMLQNDLEARQETFDPWNVRTTEGMMEIALFAPPELSNEEFLAMYDTSLDAQTIALFFGTVLMTILISTLAPILYVLRQNPKKMMM